MDSKNSPDAAPLALASHLAKPFLLPGQSGQPLSLRSLPDGGMVVIACDGRKLWFTALEVCRARREMNLPAVQPPKLDPGAKVPRLRDLGPGNKPPTAKPVGKSRDGMSEMIALPPELKYLEERIHDDSRKHSKPRTANSG